MSKGITGLGLVDSDPTSSYVLPKLGLFAIKGLCVAMCVELCNSVCA